MRVVYESCGGVWSPSIEQRVYSFGAKTTEVQPDCRGSWTAVETESDGARMRCDFRVSVAELVRLAVVHVEDGGTDRSIFFVNREKPCFCGVRHCFSFNLDRSLRFLRFRFRVFVRLGFLRCRFFIGGRSWRRLLGTKLGREGQSGREGDKTFVHD